MLLGVGRGSLGLRVERGKRKGGLCLGSGDGVELVYAFDI